MFVAVQAIQDARVRVVICRDGRFVVVRNVDGDHTWWSLPGGGLEIRGDAGRGGGTRSLGRNGLGGAVNRRDTSSPKGKRLRSTTSGSSFAPRVVGGHEYTGNDPKGTVQRSTLGNVRRGTIRC